MVKKKFFYKIRFWAGLLFAQFLLFYILSKSSSAVSIIEKIFHFKQKLQQELSSKTTISIGDLFYIFLFLLLLFYFLRIIRKKTRNKYVLKLLILLNIFYFTYQIVWGMLYFQKPIIEKLPKQEASQTEIEQLTLHYIYLTNKAREKVSEDKNGIFKIKNLDKLKTEVLENQALIPKEFYPYKTTRINNFKPSLFGKSMNYSGILGYYNPYTAEAQYNQNLPNTYIPFTLAHESSHQLGFAREQEANFIGYIICENSKNPELQYSAYLYTTKSLLRFLLQKNPEFAGQAMLFFSEKVKKDIANDKKFAVEHSGIIEDFFHVSNDLFLKSNQQEGAITYSYFIDLLIRYKRNQPLQK